MTFPLACKLVRRAGGSSSLGEVLIIEVGEPFQILDVARRMIEKFGKDIEIVFTGLLEGEKLHEELVGFKENLECRFRPQISHTRADANSPDRLD
ncbi:polysaccharide biosynthesis protein [Paeniglutamicibacter sp.]|uniref:polysaccharide biosynthesis protein n=1 Tax=Paeniglutamicibacter sp. TaxID=1934391 RepID=UPI00398936DB